MASDLRKIRGAPSKFLSGPPLNLRVQLRVSQALARALPDRGPHLNTESHADSILDLLRRPRPRSWTSLPLTTGCSTMPANQIQYSERYYDDVRMEILAKFL